MAKPRWLTPAGTLGIVPEQQYYEFALDAYDTTGAGGVSYATTFDGSHSNWTFVNGTISINSTGLPYHSYDGDESRYSPTEQTFIATFSYRGGTDTPGNHARVQSGLIGWWINGVAIYNPGASALGGAPVGYDNIPGYEYNASFAEGQLLGYGWGEDSAGGHAANQGVYHYHDFSFKDAWLSGIGGNLGTEIAEVDAIPYLNGSLTHPNGHSKILGFSLDGYPVYGPYGYTFPNDANSPIKRMTSGYTLKDPGYRTGTTTNLLKYPMGIFVNDFVYVGGSDLDQYNGRFCVTPDYPGGTYAYFVTINEDGDSVYPYVIGNNYYGTPVTYTQNMNITTNGGGDEPANTVQTTPRISGLVFSHVSGILPPGVQILPNGKIQGIPISTAGPDQNQTYRFTVRVQNETSKSLADRTFALTITNVAPPIITPKDYSLGIYFDGQQVELQLTAVEFVVEDNLTWSLKSGELPPGITLTPGGLLTGYIRPIPAVDDSNDPGWDQSAWDQSSEALTLGWDFPLGTTSKTFVFTVEVTDGVNYDVSTYSLYVYPRNSIRADSTLITVDATIVNGADLSVDTGAKHLPIITTLQSEFIPARAGGYFSINIEAIDLDDDILWYTVPPVSSGTFDEYVDGGAAMGFIAAVPISGNLYSGAWPRVSISESAATLTLYAGNVITATAGSYITQATSGANARVLANVTNSRTVPVITLGGTNFFTSQGNIAINGIEQYQAIFLSGGTWSNVGVVPFSVATEEPVTVVDDTTPNLLDGDSIHVLYPDPTTGVPVWYDATVNKHTSFTLYGNGIISGATSQYIYQPISTANARITNISVTTGTITLGGNLVTANVGEWVTQSTTGANARVIANVWSSSTIPVEYLSGRYGIGPLSGNIRINGILQPSYPSSTVSTATVAAYYTTTSPFYVDATPTTPISSAMVIIGGSPTFAFPTSIESVGVDIGSVTDQGNFGFDQGRFSQGALVLPEGLGINLETGWITGYLPSQTLNEVVYDFDVVVYKRDYPYYASSKLFKLTVLGDINNRIDWLTPSYLGTIENGAVSDLSVTAISTKGKSLFYEFTPGSSIRLPQGLILTAGGLIAGRTSFEVFCLDQSRTTIDNGTTTFDNTYSFTVTAYDSDRTISANKRFTIRVLVRNSVPYENLYLKALLSQDQRQDFLELVHNQSIFPRDMIYRNDDPNFGVAKNIKTLFLPGLNPSTLEEYTLAAATNHYTKRITFGDIKTAMAVDLSYDVEEISSGEIIGTFQDNVGFIPTDFTRGYVTQATVPNGTRLIGEHTKYEVVYAEILDENTTSAGLGPANTVELAGIIANPYYDHFGNTYTTAYPNSFTNMRDVMGTELGYANKGALPDWMTSRQDSGKVLGFTRAVVLAYTKPGFAETIAYRLKASEFNLNTFDFTVDRYQLDNNYSTNFDVANGQFLTSAETTFDRFPPLPAAFRAAGTVDYAVDIAFETINRRSVQSIRDAGGMDGILSFRDGETIVFAEQEFRTQVDIGDLYNQGWSNAVSVWDGEAWAYDTDTTDIDAPGGDPTPGLGWDEAEYVPGYNENNLNPDVINKRIGIWRIRINSSKIVTLEFVQAIELNDKLFVRNGYTYASTNIYYDPVVKEGKLVPNWSAIPQQVKTVSTRFDGNGTRFYDYRDKYTLPESGDKYIKFTKTGVFT